MRAEAEAGRGAAGRAAERGVLFHLELKATGRASSSVLLEGDRCHACESCQFRGPIFLPSLLPESHLVPPWFDTVNSRDEGLEEAGPPQRAHPPCILVFGADE